MKIFMLIKWLHNSGAPRMFAWLANGLAEKGHDVIVYTYHDYDGESVALSRKVHHIHQSLDGVGLMGKIKHIRGIIRKEDPDVSISFLLDANVFNLFSCYGLRTKSVVCERNDPFKPHYYKLYFWKPCFRLADGAVFQLPRVAEFYSNIKGVTAVIPNPVKKTDFVVSKAFLDRDNEIVTVGRIDIAQKRHDVLIKAFAKFHCNHPSYHLTIYGWGDEKDVEKIKNIISELNLHDSVTLAGAVTDSTKRITNAKMFVLSSDFEGIPNALIEAMSVGLPCVSTDCRPGGAAILINNGVNGLLVPAGDVSALAQGMSYLVEYPGVADKLAKEATNISDRFSEDIILNKWEDYLKCLSQNQC